MLTPQDLRFSNMKYFTDTQTGHTMYLLPTDQGIFRYDKITRSLKNIAQGLYLSDSRRVTVSSCPRIYSGLWHAGYFIIEPDGTAEGARYSEMSGAAMGEDRGCDTPVIYSGAFGSLYLANGISLDFEDFDALDQLSWFETNVRNRFSFTVPDKLFDYDTGWWYGYGIDRDSATNVLYKFNIEQRKVQILKQHPNSIDAFFIEKKGTKRTFWLLDEDAKLWKSTDSKKWSLYKNLRTVTIRRHTDESTATQPFVHGSELFVGSNLMIAGGNGGLFVSQDKGESWDEFFHLAGSSNVVVDKKGRLFVGLQPFLSSAEWLTENVTGVWFSDDSGQSWQRFGEGAEKSLVSGLALNNEGDVLYAATRGESLLKIRLS